MGVSHIICNKGFELAIDVDSCDGELIEKPFRITMGTGFTEYPGPSVNIETQPLDLEELKEIHLRITEILEEYSSK